MKVEIWSDIVCPWCHVGKRRFEAALARFPHRDEVEVHWRSFELDPAAPAEPYRDLDVRLARKYGMSLADARGMQEHMTQVAAAEGLAFRFDLARSGNTVDAHRLLHLAAERGVQDTVKERLLSAYLCEGEPISDRETLLRLGVEAGLAADEARAVLESERFLADVRADEGEAAALGITGVPFFVVDRRYGVSGAQPAEVLLEMLQRAWADAHPLTMVGARAAGAAGAGTASAGTASAGADACADGSCAV